MRSPAAALGATATLVDNRVGHAFARLDGPAIAELSAMLEVEARSRRLSYWRDEVAEPVRVLPRPLVALHEQLSYARYAAFTVQYALKRLPQMYVTDPAVRALFNLTGEEEAWLRDCWTPAHRDVNPLFARIDGVLDFATPNWRESLCFLEPDLGGIGGLHIVPTVDAIVVDVVLPRLSAVAPGLRLAPNVDLRDLLAQELVDHLELIGRSRSRVCLVEPKYSGYGPDEQAQLADYLRARYGITVMHADPAELQMSGDEVTYEGEVVDAADRDSTAAGLVEPASDGQ